MRAIPLAARLIALSCVLLWAAVYPLSNVGAQNESTWIPDPIPPEQTVRLVFIHHSTGENWLADGYGGLGTALAANNYYVSDTNYGWGPRTYHRNLLQRDPIGDHTDILDWPAWFLEAESPEVLQDLYQEDRQHAEYTRLADNPGGENQVVVFKSCFPNSMLAGSPDDPPEEGDVLSVGSARHTYNRLLQYFITRPDKLFVVITAPPVQDATFAANARAFNDWLVNDWLRENNYPYQNVAVWDFYNVLTAPDNHHRLVSTGLKHITDQGSDTNAYPLSEGDDHPSPEGSRKATEEFVPVLNAYYNRWQASLPVTPQPTSSPKPAPVSLCPGVVLLGLLAILPMRAHRKQNTLPE